MSTLRSLSFKGDHEGGSSEMCEGLAEEVDLHRCLIACHLLNYPVLVSSPRA